MPYRVLFFFTTPHSLGNNIIGTEGAAAIAEILKQTKTLKELWWAGGISIIYPLFFSLRCQYAILTLIIALLHSLNDNNIDTVGAVALEEAVMHNNTLTTLGWVLKPVSGPPMALISGGCGPVSFLFLWSPFHYTYQL